MAECIKVVLRCRPPLGREVDESLTTRAVSDTSLVVSPPTSSSATVSHGSPPPSAGGGGISDADRQFTFDHVQVLSPSMPLADVQQSFYTAVAAPLLEHVMAGFNVSIFAYGQTGSGKSFTMHNLHTDSASDAKGRTADNPFGEAGIIPRFSADLFAALGVDKVAGGTAPASADGIVPSMQMIEASYYEIYNEHVQDLLAPVVRGSGARTSTGGRSRLSGASDLDRDMAPESTHLRVRELPGEGPFVDGLKWHAVRDFSSLMRLLREGNMVRVVAATQMNQHSSRSHAVFTIRYTCTRINEATGGVSDLRSKVVLVDLAGSERASKTGAEGVRLKEAGAINKSLSTLGKVISTLAQMSSMKPAAAAKVHIPYRESVLTWLLKDSLGGNAKALMIATISPSVLNYEETLSTLRYADHAKQIKNHAVVNEDPNVSLIRQLREELVSLKAQLAELRSIGSPAKDGDGGGAASVDTSALFAQIESLKMQNLFQEQLVSQMKSQWEKRLQETSVDMNARASFFRGMGLKYDDEEAEEGGGQLVAADDWGMEEDALAEGSEDDAVDDESGNGVVKLASRAPPHPAPAAGGAEEGVYLVDDDDFAFDDDEEGGAEHGAVAGGSGRDGGAASSPARGAHDDASGEEYDDADWGGQLFDVSSQHTGRSGARTASNVEKAAAAAAAAESARRQQARMTAAASVTPLLVLRHADPSIDTQIMYNTRVGSTLVGAVVGNHVVLRNPGVLPYHFCVTVEVAPAVETEPDDAPVTPAHLRLRLVVEPSASVMLNGVAVAGGNVLLSPPAASGDETTGFDALSNGGLLSPTGAADAQSAGVPLAYGDRIAFGSRPVILQVRAANDETDVAATSPWAIIEAEALGTAAAASSSAEEDVASTWMGLGSPVRSESADNSAGTPRSASLLHDVSSPTAVIDDPASALNEVNESGVGSEVGASRRDSTESSRRNMLDTLLSTLVMQRVRDQTHVLSMWGSSIASTDAMDQLSALGKAVAHCNALLAACQAPYRFSRRAAWLPMSGRATRSNSALMPLPWSSVCEAHDIAHCNVAAVLWFYNSTPDSAASAASPWGLLELAQVTRLLRSLQVSVSALLSGCAVPVPLPVVSLPLCDDALRTCLAFYAAAGSRKTSLEAPHVDADASFTPPATSGLVYPLGVAFLAPARFAAGRTVTRAKLLTGWAGALGEAHVEHTMFENEAVTLHRIRVDAPCLAADSDASVPGAAARRQWLHASSRLQVTLRPVSLQLGAASSSHPVAAGAPRAGTDAGAVSNLTSIVIPLRADVAGGWVWESEEESSEATVVCPVRAWCERVLSPTQHSTTLEMHVQWLATEEALSPRAPATALWTPQLDISILQLSRALRADMHTAPEGGEVDVTKPPNHYADTSHLVVLTDLAMLNTHALARQPAAAVRVSNIRLLPCSLIRRASGGSSAQAACEPAFRLVLDPAADYQGDLCVLLSIAQLGLHDAFALQSIASARITDLRLVRTTSDTSIAHREMAVAVNLEADPHDGLLQLVQHRDPSGRALRAVLPIVRSRASGAVPQSTPSALIRTASKWFTQPTPEGHHIYIRLQVDSHLSAAAAPISFARWLVLSVGVGGAQTLADAFTGQTASHRAVDPWYAGTTPVPRIVDLPAERMLEAGWWMWYSLASFGDAATDEDVLKRLYTLMRRCRVGVRRNWQLPSTSGSGAVKDELFEAGTTLCRTGMQRVSRHFELMLTTADESAPPAAGMEGSGAEDAVLQRTSYDSMWEFMLPPTPSVVRLPLCEQLEVVKEMADKSGYLLKKQARMGGWVRRWYVLQTPFLLTFQQAAQWDTNAAPSAVFHVGSLRISDDSGPLVGVDVAPPAHAHRAAGAMGPGAAAHAGALTGTGADSPRATGSDAVPDMEVRCLLQTGPWNPRTLHFKLTYELPDSGAVREWLLQCSSMEEKRSWVHELLLAKRAATMLSRW